MDKLLIYTDVLVLSSKPYKALNSMLLMHPILTGEGLISAPTCRRRILEILRGFRYLPKSSCHTAEGKSEPRAFAPNF